MKIGVIGSIIERPRIQSLFNRSLLGIPGHRGEKTLYRWIFWIPLIFDFMRAIKKDTTMNQTRLICEERKREIWSDRKRWNIPC